MRREAARCECECERECAVGGVRKRIGIRIAMKQMETRIGKGKEEGMGMGNMTMDYEDEERKNKNKKKKEEEEEEMEEEKEEDDHDHDHTMTYVTWPQEDADAYGRKHVLYSKHSEHVHLFPQAFHSRYSDSLTMTLLDSALSLQQDHLRTRQLLPICSALLCSAPIIMTLHLTFALRTL